MTYSLGEYIKSNYIKNMLNLIILHLREIQFVTVIVLAAVLVTFILINGMTRM